MMSYAHGIRIISQGDRSILPDDKSVDKLNEKILEEMDILRREGFA